MEMHACSGLSFPQDFPCWAQVSPGDLVITEKLRHVDVNDKINIQRVLMLGSRCETIIGRPLVPGAFVTAAVEVRGTTMAQYPGSAQLLLKHAVRLCTYIMTWCTELGGMGEV